MDALSRMGAWQVVAARIRRETDALRANLASVPDIDKLRQLQGGTQALEGLLKEVSDAHDILRKQG
jgi:dihydroorotate dehydrogenase